MLFAVLQLLSKTEMVSGGEGQFGLVFHCDEYSSLPRSTGWVVKSLPLRRIALAEGNKCINASMQ